MLPHHRLSIPPPMFLFMRCMAPSHELCSFLSDLNWRSKQASKRCFSFVILHIFFCAQWQDDHCERTFLGHLVMLLAFFWSHIEISSFFHLALILKYGGYISIQMKMLSLMSFAWIVGHWFTTVNSFVNVRVGQEAVCCISITGCSTESYHTSLPLWNAVADPSYYATKAIGNICTWCHLLDYLQKFLHNFFFTIRIWSTIHSPFLVLTNWFPISVYEWSQWRGAVKLEVLYGTKRQLTERHCWVFFVLEKEPSNTFPCLFAGMLLCRWLTFVNQSCSFPARSLITKDVQKAEKVFDNASNQKITTFDATSHVPFLQKSSKWYEI